MIYRYEKAARRLCQFLLLLYYYIWGSVGTNVSQNNSFLTSLINYFSILNSKNLLNYFFFINSFSSLIHKVILIFYLLN